MQKKVVSLTEGQVKYLKRQSEIYGISVSEVLRRILDQYVYAVPPSPSGD